MDQNQSTNSQVENNQSTQNADSDLQTAIDNIANTTSVDPVFSDPVAAPSSVPEGDTGELGEPVGPFVEPEPMPAVTPVPQAPEPIAPLESANIPELNNFTAENTPAESAEPEPAPLNTAEVKKAALRDLAPLLDKVNIDNAQKFEIYRDIFNDLKDYTALEPAYQAAREISDETERAEALLYLVKSIDKM